MSEEKESRAFVFWILLGSFIVLLALAANRYVLSVRSVDVSVEPQALYPDGKSTTTIKLKLRNALGFEPMFAEKKIKAKMEEGGSLVEWWYAKDSTAIYVRAKDQAGSVTLHLTTKYLSLPLKVTVAIIQQLADSDQDGYPDAAELTSEEDRVNFRRWFTSIAESQFYKLDDGWRTEDRDCAGLLRFAYREALRKHDNDWLRKRSFLVDANIPSVRKFSYPSIPVIGERLFRIREGAFSPEADARTDSSFSSFAEARLLKEHSFFLPEEIFETRNPAM